MKDNQQGDEFKVGDTVWCVVHGKGEVIRLDEDEDDYPVAVQLEDGGVQYYTEDGKLYSDAVGRSLFFTEPKVEGSITRPFVPTLEGKTVLVHYKYGGIEFQRIGKITTEQNERFWLEDFWKVEKHDVIDIREVSSESLFKKD